MAASQRDALHAATVVVAAGELLSSEFDADAVILDLRTGVYYGLDGAGARIWQLLQRPTSLLALRDRITTEYDVDARRCETDLRELLRHLLERGLIRVAHDQPVA